MSVRHRGAHHLTTRDNLARVKQAGEPICGELNMKREDDIEQVKRRRGHGVECWKLKLTKREKGEKEMRRAG